MHPMEINRRHFLAGSTALIASAASPMRAETRATEALYAATRKDAAGAYSAAIFTPAGRDLSAVSLPSRGHDVCVCPVTKRCVAFARRPGNFAVAFSADSAAPPVRFTTPPDRHFYGHGVFSPDGRLLFATENDFDAVEGRIGIYDASDSFRRIGEFSAFGIGPHDLALLGDGTTLVIANGGIATHPDFGEGRLTLNLSEMQPSLVYIDLRQGDLIERHVLPPEFHQASLRHLDTGGNRRIVIGCQSEAGYGEDMPLVLRHRLGEDLSIVRLEAETSAALRGYISSVAVDGAGDIAAVTSSKGGLVVFVDTVSGGVLGERHIADVSGVAPAADNSSFLLTSGEGGVLSGVSANRMAEAAKTHWHWDNHAVKL
jgi:hypothetical protein